MDAATGGDQDAPAKARGDIGGLLHGNIHVVDLVVIAIEVAGPSVIAPVLVLTIGAVHGGADGDIGIVDGGHVYVGHEAEIEGLLRLAADLVGADGVIHHVGKLLELGGIVDQEVAVIGLGQLCLLGKLHSNVPIGAAAALHSELDVRHLAGLAAVPILGDLVAAVGLLFDAGIGTGIVRIHRHLKGIVLAHPVEAGLVHLRRQNDALIERHVDLGRPGGHIRRNHHIALLDGDVGQLRGGGRRGCTGRTFNGLALGVYGFHRDSGGTHALEGHEAVLVYRGHALVGGRPLDILDVRGSVLCRSRQLLSRVLGVIATQICTGGAVTRGVLDGELTGYGARKGQLKTSRQVAAIGGEGGGAQTLGGDPAEVLAIVHLVLHCGHALVTDLPGDGGVSAFLRLELSADRGGIAAADGIKRQRKLFACKFIVGGSPHQLEAGDLGLCGHTGDGDGAGDIIGIGNSYRHTIVANIARGVFPGACYVDFIVSIMSAILHRECKLENLTVAGVIIQAVNHDSVCRGVRRHSIVLHDGRRACKGQRCFIVLQGKLCRNKSECVIG